VDFNSPHQQPPWTVPIAFGAVFTFVLQALLTIGQALPVLPVQFAACCCCCVGFVPSGFVPAFLAARRDPHLTAGQGFAVAFIAVGLGTIFWTLLGATSASGYDPQLIRDAVVAAQDGVPAEQQLSAEELEELTAFLVTVLPFVPAVQAAVTTVLAGIAGMITVGFAKRR
jgi:hypothetical protein